MYLDGKVGGLSEDLENVEVSPVFRLSKLMEYEPVPYQGLMSSMPRFGHTDDLGHSILSNDPEQHVDYLFSIIFLVSVVFGLCLAWIPCICILKCKSKSFDCQESCDDDDDFDKKHEKRTKKLQPRVVRNVYYCASAVLILSSILLVTQGIGNVHQITYSVQKSTGIVRDLIYEGNKINEGFREVKEMGSLLKDNLTAALDGSKLCPSVSDFEGTKIGKSVERLTRYVNEVWDTESEALDGTVSELSTTLTNCSDSMASIDDQITTIQSYEWVGYLVALPFVVLTTLLLIGSVAAQMGVTQPCFLCILDWVVLPLFTLVTILAMVLFLTFGIVAAANADLCGGQTATPDDVFLTILEQSSLNQGGIAFKAARYVAAQCTIEAPEDPFLVLREYTALLREMRQFDMVTEKIRNISMFLDELDHIDEFIRETKEEALESIAKVNVTIGNMSAHDDMQIDAFVKLAGADLKLPPGVKITYIPLTVGELLEILPTKGLGGQTTVGEILAMHAFDALYNTTTASISDGDTKRELEKIKQCEMDLSPLNRTTIEWIDMMRTPGLASTQMVGLFECERIIPVYTNIIFEGTCQNTMTGFFWGFASLSIMSLMGLLMLTFSSATRTNDASEGKASASIADESEDNQEAPSDVENC